MTRKILILLFIPAAASAHVGPHDAGPLAAVGHALTSPDHLLVASLAAVAAVIAWRVIALRRRP